MKSFLILLTVIASVLSFNDKEQWMKFKTQHDKHYKSSIEESRRFSIFQSNLQKIEDHNLKFAKGLTTFQMGINKLADLTEHEFLESLILSKKSKPTHSHLYESHHFDGSIPSEIDWTSKGAVTEVKDQGSCGSCWSFSTTGSVESAYFLKTGQLVSLSEQNLVDCAKDDCYGCSGGWMDKALEYIEQNGIMTEKDYPYLGIDAACRFNKSNSVLQVKDYKYVKTNDEVDLQSAAAQQTVSVAIEATMLFQFYSGGVFNDGTCNNDLNSLNHGVLVVGYGSLNGSKYWKVKNSWGPSWGINGYILMSKDANNQCGIATDAVYPIL